MSARLLVWAGSGCLLVMVFTHIAEGLHLLTGMGGAYRTAQDITLIFLAPSPGSFCCCWPSLCDLPAKGFGKCDSLGLHRELDPK